MKDAILKLWQWLIYPLRGRIYRSSQWIRVRGAEHSCRQGPGRDWYPIRGTLNWPIRGWFLLNGQFFRMTDKSEERLYHPKGFGTLREIKAGIYRIANRAGKDVDFGSSKT